MILASGLAQPSLAGIFTTIGTYLTALAILAGAIPLLIKNSRDAKAAEVKAEADRAAAEADRTTRKKADKAIRRAARDARLAAEAAHIAALANQKTADATQKTAENTEHIVNSQRTEMRQHIADLTAALRAAGKPVPPDRSLDPPQAGTG